MRFLKRIWNYFFPRRYEQGGDPPLPTLKGSSNYAHHEVQFFDPVSVREKFKKAKSLKDFIHTIDTNE